MTKGIEIVVNWMGYEIDARFWSQQVSFLIVGIIAVTSIRGLLITLTKFFNAISNRKSQNLIVLILAQIMVCHSSGKSLTLFLSGNVLYFISSADQDEYAIAI